MHNDRFFDQTLAMIEHGDCSAALPMLAGKLFNACADETSWPQTREALQHHPLHSMLMEDPFSAYSALKPRGYPGDAGLIDIIYDKRLPGPSSDLGKAMFEVTVQFQAPEGVRLRRDHAEGLVTTAWRQGKRILVLACGHFREGTLLIGEDVSNIVLVDQDPVSLEVVRRNHGTTARIEAANVFRFLRDRARQGEQFDLIYTLGLTDYLDDRAMLMLHRLVRACLAPGGTFLLANFLKAHLGTGWMDAVMDWHLIYREADDLARFAAEADLSPRTWRDLTGSVVWCEMRSPG